MILDLLLIFPNILLFEFVAGGSIKDTKEKDEHESRKKRKKEGKIHTLGKFDQLGNDTEDVFQEQKGMLVQW